MPFTEYFKILLDVINKPFKNEIYEFLRKLCWLLNIDKCMFSSYISLSYNLEKKTSLS